MFEKILLKYFWKEGTLQSKNEKKGNEKKNSLF